MSGSPTQGQPSDKRASCAAEYGAPASAATMPQPPAAARGGLDTQRQASPRAQVGGELTGENELQTSRDAVPRYRMSQIDIDEVFSGREEEFFDEEDWVEPWGISQFLDDEDNVPFWARPPHASRQAAESFYRARAVEVIRDVDIYLPVSRGR